MSIYRMVNFTSTSMSTGIVRPSRIPGAHLERVFERFSSYRPGERQRDHVGLGLAIARQIVESYGGTITVSNREAGGAHFEVRLRDTPPSLRDGVSPGTN